MKKPRLARVISIECFTPRAHASVQFPSFAEVTVRFFDLVLHPHIRHAFPRLRTVVAAGPPLEANYSRAREYASTEPFAATDSKLTFATLQRPPGCYPATTETGVRRDKAALSSGCKPHPAIRSSRKQPEQAW